MRGYLFALCLLALSLVVKSQTTTCDHSLCEGGGVLVTGCDGGTCVSSICATDPYCCNTAWDSACVEEVSSICGKACGVCHDKCTTGPALSAAYCDDCTYLVCKADAYCCTTMWDSTCVTEVNTFCGNATTPYKCQTAACTHDKCDVGTALNATVCGSCVASVCAADPYCCQTSWDSACVGEVFSVCGLTTCSAGACGHDICLTGTNLTSGCNPCVTSICAVDPYCCATAWDSACVGEVASVCGSSACGGATTGSGTTGSSTTGSSTTGNPASCSHDKCTTGGPLLPSCEVCTGQICAVDPYCCQTAWDTACVGEVTSVCNSTCGTVGCGHDKCTTGDALSSTCDTCTGQVCAVDPYCCQTAWDTACVGEVTSVCGLPCKTDCSHDKCVTGPALNNATCDSCITAICAVDPFCCESSWDANCVNEVQTVCSLDCGTCAHDKCVTGVALNNVSCDSCVTQVCAVDPYCCETTWDTACVTEVNTVCLIDCTGPCDHDKCIAGGPLNPVSCVDPCVALVCTADSYCCSTAWDTQCVGEVNSVCSIDCSATGSSATVVTSTSISTSTPTSTTAVTSVTTATKTGTSTNSTATDIGSDATSVFVNLAVMVAALLVVIF